MLMISWKNVYISSPILHMFSLIHCIYHSFWHKLDSFQIQLIFSTIGYDIFLMIREHVHVILQECWICRKAAFSSSPSRTSSPLF